MPVTGLTAYSEVEGAVKLDCLHSCSNDCFAIFAVNKSVVDWLTSNYGIYMP